MGVLILANVGGGPVGAKGIEAVVDGKSQTSNLIPVFAKAVEHEVKVVLG